MVEKILNQEQIDAMVRNARGSKGPDTAREKRVAAWDARHAGQIGREQMRAISALHESFARNLTHSLGAYLRTGFNAELASAEYLSYGEFLQRVPELTYLALLRLKPLEETALLQLDLPIAFPLIDILLGGEGKGTPPTRDITEIEEVVLETLVRLVCLELQNAWRALSLEFEFKQREQVERISQLRPFEEKTLTLSFEIKLSESRGTLNVMVPAIVSNALLKKISAGMTVVRANARDSGEQLRMRLLDCPFPAQLDMTSIPVSLRELSCLKPGDLLPLRRSITTPATLVVGGQEMFISAVAKRGTARAAKLFEPILEHVERKRKA